MSVKHCVVISSTTKRLHMRPCGEPTAHGSFNRTSRLYWKIIRGHGYQNLVFKLEMFTMGNVARNLDFQTRKPRNTAEWCLSNLVIHVARYFGTFIKIKTTLLQD